LSRISDTPKSGKLLVATLALVLTGFNVFAAQQVTLTWEPTQEIDVQGYGIYITRNASGPPYDLFGYVAKSEFPDPGTPAFTVPNLQQGETYRFAVTAYTAQGAESAFSNEVCAQMGDVVVPCAPSASSGASDSGGGGGGGCFIGTASAFQPGAGWLQAAGALGVLVAGMFGGRRRA